MQRANGGTWRSLLYGGALKPTGAGLGLAGATFSRASLGTAGVPQVVLLLVLYWGAIARLLMEGKISLDV